MNRLFLVLPLLAGLLVCTSCSKKHKSTAHKHDHSLFEKLKCEDVLQLKLETDIDYMLADKSLAEYQPALLTFHPGTKEAHMLPINVRLRGNTRKDICSFPPLKLKFPSERLDSMEVKPFSTLKLVTHCNTDSTFKQLLFKEFVTYKMYASLTDHAFDVQLVEVEYIDAARKLESQKHYGFIIENQKELAHRLNADLLSNSDPAIKTIHQDQYKMFIMFQYMVGNTDWNLTNRHNIEVVIPEENPSPVPIPYDFDFSGLVNAPYAKPYPTMPISSVRERLFQWRGDKDADFTPVAAKFLEKKNELMEVCNSFNRMAEKEKTDMTMYIGSFFEKLEQANGNVTASYFMDRSKAD
ncbi:MAG: hypothetical protein AAF502_14645 [Bacteroidota bacterium]